VTLSLCLSLLLSCHGPAALDDSGPIDSSAGIGLGEVQACAAPLPGPAWTEEGEAWGLIALGTEITDHEEGPSIAAGDIDGDGLIDLAILMQQSQGQLYLNQGDHFQAQSTMVQPGAAGLLIDLDGDSDLDLIAGGGTPSALRNDGGSFSPWNLPSLFPTGPSYQPTVHDLSPGDLDGDGTTELYLALGHNFADESKPLNDELLHLGADGLSTLTDVVPMDVGARHGFDALWFDEDGDGDLDLYLANDLAMNYGASTLLRNEGGQLVDGADDCFCSLYQAAKGVDIADVDGNGQPELYVTGSPLSTLLSRLDDGAWVDISTATQASQLMTNATGWGGIFLDYDNDGHPDILSAQGDRWNSGNDHPHFDAPLQVLHQEDGVFVDRAAELGLDVLGSFRAALAWDLNADGVEDLLVTHMDGRPYLFLSEGCTAAGWLEVEAPIGSRVQVRSGDQVQTGWARMDEGYQSTRPPRLHFGLGAAQTVDDLVITLPGGEVRALHSAFDARRVVTLSP